MHDKKHLVSIDLIRLISFLAILMVHVSKVIFERQSQIDAYSWWWAMFFNSISRFGTPMFIMVSGYLMLGSDSSLDTKLFYKKRLKRILWPMFFWNVFYYILYIRLNTVDWGWHDFFVRFISGGTYYHLYFLQLILGLYVITPLLKKYLNKINLNVVVPSLYLISFGYLYAYTNGIITELNNTFLWFIPYIGYYLAGYWVGNMKKVNSWWWLGVAILLMLVGIVANGNYLAQRISINVAIASTIIFSLVLKLEHLSRKLMIMSEYGMGLYLVHPLIIELFINKWMVKNPLWWMGLTYLFSFILSVGLVFMIKKVRWLSSVV